jgi:hypothetical protein
MFFLEKEKEKEKEKLEECLRITLNELSLPSVQKEKIYAECLAEEAKFLRMGLKENWTFLETHEALDKYRNRRKK